MMNRKDTQPVFLGARQIGGGAPVVVQSMTCTDTRDIEATLQQIRELEEAGCEIVRVAVPDMQAAKCLFAIKKNSSLPLIADIHFDYRLAIEAMKQGVEGIRINPGNISRRKIQEIVKSAKDGGTVIRIGINSGSLEKDILSSYGGPTAGALVESALRNIHIFEDLDFRLIKLSLKSSDVGTMIEAYRSISEKCVYPLHLGVTEAGTILNSAIKSSLGIGILLNEGIGDTIRVSITGNPVAEMRVAYGILRGLGLRKIGPEIISCPTCGRCEINVLQLAEEVEKRLQNEKHYLKIALMGCVVNGPGEAAEADIGIAGGRGFGYLFKKGKKICKVREENFLEALMEEIKQEIQQQEV